MTTVTEHYEKHLAPIYVWMTGGFAAALESGAAEIDALNLPLAQGAVVFDLGAGFGMHAIPLARRGARVTAIDTSTELLRTLTEMTDGLPIQAVNDELLEFQNHVSEAPSAILCMGDTITHLPDFNAVEVLIERVCAALPLGGTFVVSFRDYSVPLVGDHRFIPVRSDDSRIFTCFLEYEPECVLVHDILHQHTPDGWQTHISSYRKLRLSPEYLVTQLQTSGFNVRREAGMRGAVRLVAQRGFRVAAQ
ncbi:class I SAM-dependent methyltransferase [Hydrogenophaga sp. A37]|uniref:class I SAM-dependent methyltransferase n=1 Tax=Hydrogenophaga sp. A37 TaxID=1945864 RepID=UPI0009845551|nr:methyltransferase domain-containing protein [Hydrogenophaga sp. A37]OOG78778.1 SAM-dependent methyltransferase [Hydrogenophaga sp. A37]